MTGKIKMAAKILSVGAILIIVFALPVFSQGLTPEQTEQMKQELQKLGAQFSDDGRLIVPKGANVPIPPDLPIGIIEVNGGSIQVPSTYTGSIKVSNGGTVYLSQYAVDKEGKHNSVIEIEGGTVQVGSEVTVSGKGTVIGDAISIEKGEFNNVPMTSAMNLKYDEKSDIIKGLCSENCEVGGIQYGDYTVFYYKKNPDGTSTVTLGGNRGTTTVKNANFVVGKDGNVYVVNRGEWFPDMKTKVNVKESFIYLAKGDTTQIYGQTYKAEWEVTAIRFEFDKINGEIVATSPLRRVIVPKKGDSVYSFFKDAGYGDDDFNFLIRKTIYCGTFKDECVSGNPLKTYLATPSQDKKFMEALSRDESVRQKVDLYFNDLNYPVTLRNAGDLENLGIAIGGVSNPDVDNPSSGVQLDPGPINNPAYKKTVPLGGIAQEAADRNFVSFTHRAFCGKSTSQEPYPCYLPKFQYAAVDAVYSEAIKQGVHFTVFGFRNEEVQRNYGLLSQKGQKGIYTPANSNDPDAPHYNGAFDVNCFTSNCMKKLDEIFKKYGCARPYPKDPPHYECRAKME